MIQDYHNMKKYLSLIFVICFFSSTLWAQYYNPFFGGAGNSGYGEAGTHLSGPIYGIYNPATLYLDYPRINQSVTTGQFSDFYLFFPTIKDLSLGIPVIPNSLFIRAYYGKPLENNLRYRLKSGWIHNPDIYYQAGNKRAGLSVAYKIPLTQLLPRGHFFDVRLGLDMAEYWGTSIFRTHEPDSVLNGFWVKTDRGDHGVTGRFGSLIHFINGSRYQFSLGTVLSAFYSMQTRHIGYDRYAFSLGIKYSLKTGSSIRFGAETENYFTYYKQKLSFGAQYNFSDFPLNSFQFGVFKYPKNIRNIQYRNQPGYWYTIGFTKSFHNWIICASLSDPINLSLSHKSPPSSDVAKILSFTVSVPLNGKILHKKKEKSLFPEFIDLSLGNREIVIGKKDTLKFYLKLFGRDSLVNPRVFFNVEPKKGMIINSPFIQLPTMHPLDMIAVEVPITAVAGLEASDYDIAASLTYGNDQIMVKNFRVQTVKPQIDVVYEFNAETRYILFPVPGSYILTLKFTNYGNYKSDSLTVNLSDEMLAYGLVEKSQFVLKDIQPNMTKLLKIYLNSVSDTLPPKIPVTFRFTESNGFDPLPIHSEIVIIDKNKISINQVKRDPFLSNFADFNEFYIVFKPSWDTVKRIKKETRFKLSENSKFPGKLVMGPFSRLEVVLAYQQSIQTFISDYEIVAVNKSRLNPVLRYFYSISNTDESKRKLKELSIDFVHADRQNPSLLLIGPFINLNTILELEDFMEEFFPEANVVSRYPNQVIQ